MKNKFCQVWLTCEDKIEASKIASVLLDKHLIACAKQTSINSDFWWKGAKTASNEILLIMESREDLFEAIEKEVTKLHSYETFVLQAIPLIKISQKAKAWLTENLQS